MSASDTWRILFPEKETVGKCKYKYSVLLQDEEVKTIPGLLKHYSMLSSKEKASETHVASYIEGSKRYRP